MHCTHYEARWSEEKKCVQASQLLIDSCLICILSFLVSSKSSVSTSPQQAILQSYLHYGVRFNPCFCHFIYRVRQFPLAWRAGVFGLARHRRCRWRRRQRAPAPMLSHGICWTMLDDFMYSSVNPSWSRRFVWQAYMMADWLTDWLSWRHLILEKEPREGSETWEIAVKKRTCGLPERR